MKKNVSFILLISFVVVTFAAMVKNVIASTCLDQIKETRKDVRINTAIGGRFAPLAMVAGPVGLIAAGGALAWYYHSNSQTITELKHLILSAYDRDEREVLNTPTKKTHEYLDNVFKTFYSDFVNAAQRAKKKGKTVMSYSEDEIRELIIRGNESKALCSEKGAFKNSSQLISQIVSGELDAKEKYLGAISENDNLGEVISAENVNDSSRKVSRNITSINDCESFEKYSKDVSAIAVLSR